jgi:hypothetical protein
MVEINKYQNSKIYRIINDENDEVYVGSTYNMLCRRMEKHRSHRFQYAHRPLYKLMNEIGIAKFHIELIEEYPCDNKEQLRKREGHFIRGMGTLNMVIEERTKKEYKETNKDKIEYMAKYREEKKDQILAKTKEYRENHKDEIKQYKINNKEHILAQNKEYYERTKEHKQEYQKSDKVKAWKNAKVECPCGGSYTNCHKAEHFKCTRHKKYEEQNK